jgi:hypothetical protein
VTAGDAWTRRARACTAAFRHRRSSARPTLLPDDAYGRAAAQTRIPTELVPYAVREEHEGGQHADTRSHAIPGLDARGTTKAGLRPGERHRSRRSPVAGPRHLHPHANNSGRRDGTRCCCGRRRDLLTDRSDRVPQTPRNCPKRDPQLLACRRSGRTDGGRTRLVLSENRSESSREFDREKSASPVRGRCIDQVHDASAEWMRFDQAHRDLVVRRSEQAISRTEHHRVDREAQLVHQPHREQ